MISLSMEERSRYKPILILALSMWLAGGTCALAQVDTSGFDWKNPKRYGNCFVATGISMLTDEERHTFGCAETRTNLPVPVISFESWQGQIVVGLIIGEISHPTDRIPGGHPH